MANKILQQGLYIHFPFCKKKCSYCAFYSQSYIFDYQKYIHTLIKEATANSSFLPNKKIDTIYLGGGTPSIVPVNYILELFNSLSKIFDLSECSEITIEANPDDVDIEWITSLKSTPINRISIGIQSFNDNELSILNRRHNAKGAAKALDLIASHYPNYSLDLMYGLPEQTMKSWEYSIEQALFFQPQHISAYSLSVEPNTPLDKMSCSNIITIPEEDFSIDCYNMLNDKLKDSHFEHYEISNYCKSGYKAIHNSNYWKAFPYLGIGPAAHSFNGDIRKWNINSLEKYSENVQNDDVYYEIETLDTDMKYNEYIMLGLRTNNGIDFDEIENKYGKIYATHTFATKKNINKSLIMRNDNILSLNEKGFLLADRIASNFFVL